MAEYKPNKIFNVCKTEGDDPDFLVYIFTPEQWDKFEQTPAEANYMDVFAACDEVTALSRAKMQYPDFVIGATEGDIKEWR